jgi:hypothetical protein
MIQRLTIVALLVGAILLGCGEKTTTITPTDSKFVQKRKEEKG